MDVSGIRGLLGERGPLPEIVDQDSEACWALWNACVKEFESTFRRPPDTELKRAPGSVDHALP